MIRERIIERNIEKLKSEKNEVVNNINCLKEVLANGPKVKGEDCNGEIICAKQDLFSQEEKLERIKNNIVDLEKEKCNIPEAFKEEVGVYSCVTVRDLKRKEDLEYLIFNSSLVIDPSLGIISSKSPLAEAVMGSKMGDIVEFFVNNEKEKLKILEIN